MVKKKSVKKKAVKKTVKKKVTKKKAKKKVFKKKIVKKLKVDVPTLKLRTEHDIAQDFAVKAYKKFDKIIKSVVLFGSTAKHTAVAGSDIDIILVVDDVSVRFDQEMITWYRIEMEKIISANPYKSSLHINTVKLSTWWEDLMRGDPVIMNILRNGEAILDYGGFFEPLKYLLIEGKIKSTPEAIYTALQRAPTHLARSRLAELNAVEGLYWAMVDSAHGALIAAGASPPSPEHIPTELKIHFVDKGMLKMKYVEWYQDILVLHKRITHGEIRDLDSVSIDEHQKKTEDFMSSMVNLTKKLIE